MLLTPVRARNQDAISIIANSTDRMLNCVAGAGGNDYVLRLDCLLGFEVYVEESRKVLSKPAIAAMSSSQGEGLLGLVRTFSASSCQDKHLRQCPSHCGQRF